jgi:heme-degrading monooxygenase HmoA
MIVVMVRIPIGSVAEGERLAERFRNRAGLVVSHPGFLGFELLKGEGEYVSMTRWASREDLDRWMRSEAHAQAHARVSTGTLMTGGHPQSGEGREHQGAQQHGEGGPRASSTAIYEVILPAKGQG